MSKRWKMLDLTWEGRLSHPSKVPIPIVLTPFWNIDAREGITVRKSVIPNTCHTVWNVDTCKGIATRKSPIPNTCHTVRNVDAF